MVMFTDDAQFLDSDLPHELMTRIEENRRVMSIGDDVVHLQ